MSVGCGNDAMAGQGSGAQAARAQGAGITRHDFNRIVLTGGKTAAIYQLGQAPAKPEAEPYGSAGCC